MDSTSNKRARTSPAPSTQLVVCFMHEQQDDSVSYCFEFFRIQDLLDSNTLLKPTHTLPWPENKEFSSLTNNIYVKFLHSKSLNHPDDDDDARLGVLYAVGGLTPSEFRPCHPIPETIPNASFTRISLSGGRKMLDYYDTPMNAGKLFPLVAEIDHRIYVLSAPPNHFRECYEVPDNFEVYDPRDFSWKPLPDLPFINYPQYTHTYFFGGDGYSRLVLGQKLFVSDLLVSSVYDIKSNTWSACHLFSDCYIPPCYEYYGSKSLPKNCGPGFPFLGESLPKNCGPGFPFLGEALLWKGEFILCMMPDRGQRKPMAAYRIEKLGNDQEEKARPLELGYDYEGTPFPNGGDGRKLVDIGDDHFAFIILTRENYEDFMNIFTFKLETDATNQDRLLVKDLTKRYSKIDELCSSYFVYSFAC